MPSIDKGKRGHTSINLTHHASGVKRPIRLRLHERGSRRRSHLPETGRKDAPDPWDGWHRVAVGGRADVGLAVMRIAGVKVIMMRIRFFSRSMCSENGEIGG